MNRLITLLRVLVFLAVATASGCAVTPKPFDYQPDNELKPGPGLFSGKDGAFTIYRQPMTSNAADIPAAQE